MSIKDLFNDIDKVNVSTTASLPQIQEFNNELESSNYAFQVNKDKHRFVPNVDFSEPKNFARFANLPATNVRGSGELALVDNQECLSGVFVNEAPNPDLFIVEVQ